MIFTPHDYQTRASRFVLKHNRCALHMDVGTGKTATTLLALNSLLSSYDARGAVVFAPKRVARIAWPDEIQKWDNFKHLTHKVIAGMSPESCWLMREPRDITLLNYEVLPWFVDWVKAEIARRPLPFDMLVLDESSRLKSHDSSRFKALKPLADSTLFPRIVELTGTPSPESYEDLFAQYRLLDGGERLEKGITKYRTAYFIQNPYSKFEWNIRPGAEKTIQDKIADITVTIRAEEYLQLPKLLENDIYVELSEEAYSQYRTLEKDVVARIKDETIAAPTAAMVSEKCRQLVSGAVYKEDGTAIPLHEEKFDALDELVETDTGNLLVAYWYRHEFDTIRKRYPNAPVLGPKMSDIEANRAVRDWNAGKVKLLFMHPASVGHGINLQTGGCNLVWLTIPWSNEIYQQTVGRLHRMGQTKPVVVHRILVKRTIDMVVDRAIKSKEFNQQLLRKALAALHKG